MIYIREDYDKLVQLIQPKQDVIDQYLPIVKEFPEDWNADFLRRRFLQLGLVQEEDGYFYLLNGHEDIDEINPIVLHLPLHYHKTNSLITAKVIEDVLFSNKSLLAIKVLSPLYIAHFSSLPEDIEQFSIVIYFKGNAACKDIAEAIDRIEQILPVVRSFGLEINIASEAGTVYPSQSIGNYCAITAVGTSCERTSSPDGEECVQFIPEPVSGSSAIQEIRNLVDRIQNFRFMKNRLPNYSHFSFAEEKWCQPSISEECKTDNNLHLHTGNSLS